MSAAKRNISCAVSAWKKANAGKSASVLVSELIQDFSSPDRTAPPEQQVRNSIRAGINLLKNENSPFFMPGKAELINTTLKSVGFGKRGRQPMTQSDREEVLSLLDDVV